MSADIREGDWIAPDYVPPLANGYLTQDRPYLVIDAGEVVATIRDDVGDAITVLTGSACAHLDYRGAWFRVDPDWMELLT